MSTERLEQCAGRRALANFLDEENEAALAVRSQAARKIAACQRCKSRELGQMHYVISL